MVFIILRHQPIFSIVLYYNRNHKYNEGHLYVRMQFRSQAFYYDDRYSRQWEATSQCQVYRYGTAHYGIRTVFDSAQLISRIK